MTDAESLAISQEIAQRRRDVHFKAGNYHPTVKGDALEADIEGVLGELAFAEAYGYPVPRYDLPHGDLGIDFVTPVGTVDVKAARFGRNLINLAEKSGRADFLVLAHVDTRTGRSRLVGWVNEPTFSRGPVVVLRDGGPLTQRMMAEDLNPMRDMLGFHSGNGTGPAEEAPPVPIKEPIVESRATSMTASQMTEEWRRISVPQWERILKDSVRDGHDARADYARNMLDVVLRPPGGVPMFGQQLLFPGIE
jgi:hypothetical protein